MSHPTAWARHYRFVERLEMTRQRERHARVMREIEADLVRVGALLGVLGHFAGTEDSAAGDVARIPALRLRVAEYVSRCRSLRP